MTKQTPLSPIDKFFADHPEIAVANAQSLKQHCGFARSGTYGHECGAPAVKVGLKKVASTKSGIFYARRCAQCASIKGGENADISEWQQFDPVQHINRWA